MIAEIKKISKYCNIATIFRYMSIESIHYIYLFFLFLSIFFYLLNIMWCLVFNILFYIYIQNVIDIDIILTYYVDKYVITFVMYVMFLVFYFYCCKIFFIE